MSLGAGPSLCFCSVLNVSPHITFLSQSQKDLGLPESQPSLLVLLLGAGLWKVPLSGQPWFESRLPLNKHSL